MLAYATPARTSLPREARSDGNGGVLARVRAIAFDGHAPPLLDTLTTTTWFFGQPSALTGAAFDSLTIAQQSMLVGGPSRFGDGKPVVLFRRISAAISRCCRFPPDRRRSATAPAVPGR